MHNIPGNLVYSYTDNIFIDLTVADSNGASAIERVAQYIPSDSINTGCKMALCLDPFSFMDVENSLPFEKNWLVHFGVLNLACETPQGYLKQYCQRQCQTLIAQLDNSGMH
ncbi:MAG: hypothetical protein ACJA0E_000544 [Bermanella sp.]|jgi:hypothetical protein